MTSAETAVRPEEALQRLAHELRGERSVISDQVIEPKGEPALGLLAAAGPRTRVAPGEYALVVEAVREGYLLHYGTPRLVLPGDGDLALLAGDYLYALGLDRLAVLGDLEAVRELSDLISLCAQAHADGQGETRELWLASAVAIAAGPSPQHNAAKLSLRAGAADARPMLFAAAELSAAEAGLGDALSLTAEKVGFPASESR